MKAAITRCCIAVLTFVVFVSAAMGQEPPRGQQIRECEGKSQVRQYLFYLPEEYGKADQKWPMIVYLHGASSRGSNMSRVRRSGIPWLADHEKGFPFITIAPQCPKGKRWVDLDTAGIMKIIDDICAEYAVDRDRIYVTGVSMGGHGAWYLAYKYPDRFAAVAPLCGRVETTWAETLKQIPSWVFHGNRDRVCPIRYSNGIVDALKSFGASVKYTVYKGAGHDIVTRTYRRELFDWFLQHRRNDDRSVYQGM